jgi:DNA-directed RNA polymerase subunit F
MKMTKPQIMEETPITMAKLKEELKKIRKRDDALNFRAEKTEEYLSQFVTLKDKEAKDLYKKVEELDIPRLKPEHIVKIIDILPTTPEEVKLVLQGYTITVTKENLKRVADAIQEFTKKE